MVSIGAALAIAGIVLFAIAGLAVKKKKQRMPVFVIASIIGVVGILGIANVVPQLGQEIDLGALAAGVETDDGVVVQRGEGLCAVEDTTVTLSGQNRYTALASGGTHRYWLDGAPSKTVSDAGAFTASPGDVIKILWMNGSETDGTYFSAVTTEKVPCLGTVTFYNDELVSNSTVTIDVFNEDGNKIDAANNESLAAGDVTTLTARMKAQFEKGQPYGGVVVCTYNRTAYDDCIVDFGGTEVSVPQIFDTISSWNSRAYSVPAILGTEQLDGTVTIDVDDTNDPTTEGINSVNLTYYPNDYFINEDIGGMPDGPAVEDEDDAQTKAYSATTEIYVS